MQNNKIESNQKESLHKQLWAIANEMRSGSGMEASEFKNYILGIIFYRFLSENMMEEINDELQSENMTYEQAWEKEEYKKVITEELTRKEGKGYIIEPQYTWEKIVEDVKNDKFTVVEFKKAKNKLEESTRGKESESDFEGLFDDVDLDSKKLGVDEAARSKVIGNMILRVNEIDFQIGNESIDLLGDAYEYLIGQFAATAGKSAGEFYTPQQVSSILAKIVSSGKKQVKKVYDPTCGSGSLLIRIGKETEVGQYFGQEKTNTTYNLARMNMILHGIQYNLFDIAEGDTIEKPKENHMNQKYDAIVANPPYSQKWSGDEKYLNDPRFSGYGKLAPKSKEDYVFVQHMLHLLDDNGTMAVVLPHGVLFRGAAEGTIRKALLEKNYIDAIIGLPANLFFGTSIPTSILVFKKNKKDKKVLFIDASKEFEAAKNKNQLSDANVQKIVDTYKERKEIEKYSYLASYEDIKENEYNLNIPRYVDTFEEEEPIDIKEVLSNIKKLEKERDELDKEINKYLDELGLLGELDEK